MRKMNLYLGGLIWESTYNPSQNIWDFFVVFVFMFLLTASEIEPDYHDQKLNKWVASRVPEQLLGWGWGN